MNGVLGVVILGAAAAGARIWTASTLEDRVASALATATVFLAIFLSAFLVQGFLELATHRPIVALPFAAAFVVAFLAAAVVVRRDASSRVRSGPSRAPRRAQRGWRRLSVGAAGVVFVVFVVCYLLLLGGFPRGFEVQAYHLPLAIRILRDGTLGIWDASFMHAYPVNMSVWAGFFLDLVPERVASIVNLPFLVLLCAAVYAMARAVGSDRSAALLVAAGVTTVPMIGASALEVGADVAGVGLVLVATYMLAARPGPRATCALYAGLAAGLAYGFKSLHLIPAVLLGGLALVEGLSVATRARRTGGGGAGAALAPFAVYALAATAMMSFWLVRNYVQAGNPLYPVHLHFFDLFGWRAAPDFDLGSRGSNELEWVGASREWLVYPWVEGHYINQNFKHSSGLGAFFATVVPAVVLLWPIHFVVHWRSTNAGLSSAVLRAQAVVYAMGIAVVAAWWMLGDRQPRYVMFSVVLVFPLAGWLVSCARGRLRFGYELLLAICTLAMVVVILVRTAATNGVMLAQRVNASRHEWLEYPAAIDHLPPGSVVADSENREHNYLLLGEGLRNRVIDMQEVNRRFVQDGDTLRLTLPGVLATGMTHFYTASDRKLSTDECLRLRELDRLDHNPFNGQRFEAARVLYAVDRVCTVPRP